MGLRSARQAEENVAQPVGHPGAPEALRQDGDGHQGDDGGAAEAGEDLLGRKDAGNGQSDQDQHGDQVGPQSVGEDKEDGGNENRQRERKGWIHLG